MKGEVIMRIFLILSIAYLADYFKLPLPDKIILIPLGIAIVLTAIQDIQDIQDIKEISRKNV